MSILSCGQSLSSSCPETFTIAVYPKCFTITTPNVTVSRTTIPLFPATENILSLLLVLMAASTASVVTYPVDHRGVKHLIDSTPDLRTLPPAYTIPDPALKIQPVAAASLSNFPVIDISKLNDPASHASVVKDITSAGEDGGFFLVVNHNVKPSTMSGLISAVEAFFALPLEEKMKYASEDEMAPIRYGSSVNANAPQPQHFWRDYLRYYDRPVNRENSNLWPTTPFNYAQLTKEFLDGTWELSLQLARAISEGLGKEANYVEGTFGEGLQTVSCNYYPPCPQPELALGVCAHKDQGAISMLIDNQVDGLQMKDKEGNWIQVPHVPGALVVLLGEFLEIVSDEKMKAAEHRVVVNDKIGRISAAVGNGPDLKIMAESRKGRGPCPPTVLRFV